jgi:hypothetical protein
MGPDMEGKEITSAFFWPQTVEILQGRRYVILTRTQDVRVNNARDPIRNGGKLITIS